MAQDICQREVALSTSNLEGLANSVIGKQSLELQTTAQIVGNLQQHLSQVEQTATEEAQGKMLVEERAQALASEQQAEASYRLSSLKTS